MFLRTALLFWVEHDASATSLLKYLLFAEGFSSSLPWITFRLEQNKLTKSYKLSYKANNQPVTFDAQLIIHLRISQYYNCVAIQRQHAENRHQEFLFLLWYAAHLRTENEHQVLNDSHNFISFTRILLLIGPKFQYSRKRRQDEDGKQSDKAAIRDLVLPFCPTMHSVQQRTLQVLMPV